MSADPIALLFGGMEKLGPGGNEHTLRVLRQFGAAEFRTVVDAGCGTGRQTLALARELRTRIHAVDLHEPFLAELVRRAREAKLDHLVQAHCMDMRDIPQKFRNVDLLWSEGAAYNMGFAAALEGWAAALAPDARVAVSELSWLKPDAPRPVQEFFAAAYPAMQSVHDNTEIAERAGYRVLGIHTLPPSAWTEGYYDVLGPRAQSLLDHADAPVRAFAAETLKEMEIFGQREESFGYVFYILAR